MHPCPHCSKETNNKKYCSISCSAKVNSALRGAWRECRYCGKRTRNLQFCSHSCSARINNIGVKRHAGSSLAAYSWVAIQAYLDSGKTFKECQSLFGVSESAILKAKKRGDILDKRYIKPLKPLDELKTRGSVRKRLIKLGKASEVCEQCGVKEWQGQKLSLQLHHRNGVAKDHQESNLQWLCPNCHSLTDTWTGKNIKKVNA